MSSVTTIGLDLAKNVFQVHGVNMHGKTIIRKKIRRSGVLTFFANIPPVTIGIEACAGANFWARKLEELGHTVLQMSPQFVKPYIKTNKNDANDAEGICEAVTRPSMRFVPNKNNTQIDAQSIIRVRDSLVSIRTAQVNQARGLLLEYGIAIPKSITKFKKSAPIIWEDLNNELTPVIRDIVSDSYTRIIDLDEQIAKYNKQISNITKKNEPCELLLQIPGIGNITALALFAGIGNGSNFRNGRHLAAWIGLVPKQNSSGNKNILLGISKRGNKILRKLFIQGAHSVVSNCSGKTDKVSLWLQNILLRRGRQKACVAYANKMARFAWAVLSKNVDFDPKFISQKTV
jgi:transposase